MGTGKIAKAIGFGGGISGNGGLLYGIRFYG
jgi:hypothetical protein